MNLFKHLTNTSTSTGLVLGRVVDIAPFSDHKCLTVLTRPANLETTSKPSSSMRAQGQTCQLVDLSLSTILLQTQTCSRSYSELRGLKFK
jgi:hypothetical protein